MVECQIFNYLILFKIILKICLIIIYIKDVIEEHNTIIIELKDTIFDLQSQIKM